MARYYILTGYIIPIFHNGVSNSPLNNANLQEKKEYYESHGIEFPKNYTLVKISPKLEIKVVRYNFDEGLLLIKAPSRRDAYSIANAIRGLFGIFLGWMPDDRSGNFFLQEIGKIPQPSWSKSNLLEALRELDYGANTFLLLEFSTGYLVDERSLNKLVSFIHLVKNDPNILEAMNHLLESGFLFCGFMSGSYYHHHYSRERRAITHWMMEKRYFENRYRYELAFLAAFKGIECYFRVNSFKKHEIRSLFNNISYHDVCHSTEYTRLHEIFSGLPKKVKYEELLEHFLRIRNVVAAHSNRKPPKDFIISEDNIFEIQFFLVELISKALDSQKEKP